MKYIDKIKSFYSHPGFQNYLQNTSWLVLEKGFRIVVAVFVGAWVTRHLGPAEFGAFQYSLSFVSIFASLATLGLDQIVIKELVKNESRRDVLLGTSFALKVGGASLSFLLLIAVLLVKDNSDSINTMILLAAAAIFLQSFNVIDFYFRSKVISKYAVYANFICLLLSSIVKIVLILFDASAIAFAAVFIFEAFVVALGFIYFYLKSVRSNLFSKWKFDRTLAKELLSTSWPLIFGGMLLMIQARIDQVMLKELSTEEEVGFYSVALKTVELFGFIPMLLQSSLMPSLINSKKASLDHYKNRLLNYYRLNFILFLFVAIPIFFFSDLIIKALYGEPYLAAVPLLSFMAIRLFFANMGVARTTYINIEGQFKYSMATMLIGTVVNIVLNYFLIPNYLSMGAIFSTIVSFFVTIFFFDFFYKKMRSNAVLQLKSILTFFNLRLDFIKKSNS